MISVHGTTPSSLMLCVPRPAPKSGAQLKNTVKASYIPVHFQQHRQRTVHFPVVVLLRENCTLSNSRLSDEVDPVRLIPELPLPKEETILREERDAFGVKSVEKGRGGQVSRNISSLMISANILPLIQRAEFV
jgi:hypothetical protein